MTRLVAQWPATGESQASFARRHGMRPWTLWYWSRKVAAIRGVEPPQATFVPVRVTAEPARGIEVVLASGDRLHVPVDASVEVVRTAITALRSGC
jgi:transposase-like protein